MVAITLEVWVLTYRVGIYRRISSLGPAPNNLLSKPYPEPSLKPMHQVLDYVMTALTMGNLTTQHCSTMDNGKAW